MTTPGTRGPALALAFFLVATLGSCSKKEQNERPAPEGAPESPDSLTVYTVNYPLAYFAQRLAPEGVEVVFPVPPDVDPAFWKPTAEAIGGYQRADLILLNGAGYARWTRYATLPRSRMVVTADGCRKAFIETEDVTKHQHGPEGEHAHGGTAFTTWLDFRLAACQAAQTRDALKKRLPAAANDIDERYAGLENDLRELDLRLRGVAKAWGGQPFLASHPVYQYLSDAYGLQVESLHFEPDQALDSEDLKQLDAILAEHPEYPVKLMLWEGAPLQSTADELLKRGVSPLVFAPTSQPPKSEDFLKAMQQNVARLECATGALECR